MISHMSIVPSSLANSTLNYSIIIYLPSTFLASVPLLVRNCKISFTRRTLKARTTNN